MCLATYNLVALIPVLMPYLAEVILVYVHDSSVFFVIVLNYEHMESCFVSILFIVSFFCVVIFNITEGNNPLFFYP